MHDISKMGYSELLPIYAKLVGVSTEAVQKQTESEVRNQVLNDVKAKNADLSDEEIQQTLDLELKSMGEKGFNETARQNVYGKILTQAQKTCEQDLTKQAKDNSVQFPLKEDYKLGNSIELKIEATKKHNRRYLLGTDYVGRDMKSVQHRFPCTWQMMTIVSHMAKPNN